MAESGAELQTGPGAKRGALDLVQFGLAASAAKPPLPLGAVLTFCPLARHRSLTLREIDAILAVGCELAQELLHCTAQALFTTIEATPPTLHQSMWPVAMSRSSQVDSSGASHPKVAVYRPPASGSLLYRKVMRTSIWLPVTSVTCTLKDGPSSNRP